MKEEDPPKSEHGFALQGVPNWASLWAKATITNSGLESGTLYLKLDKERNR